MTNHELFKFWWAKYGYALKKSIESETTARRDPDRFDRRKVICEYIDCILSQVTYKLFNDPVFDLIKAIEGKLANSM